ncbi:MAG: hypothetical protein KF690_10270 [Bacteroidetes bacterium]|nr:hypothetical protein [Bacteroidota bacterium]
MERVALHLRLLGFLCVWGLAACRKECDYKAPPAVQITPIYIKTNPIGQGGPPIQFLPQPDTVLEEAGEEGGGVFYTGGWDGLTLPLDYTRNELLLYFRHEGELNRVRLRYKVVERWIDSSCGFVTEYTDLQLLTHDLIDCRINDQELQLYYRLD